MISIEANIGAGKSTFLKELVEKWDKLYNVIPEPLDLWKEKHGDNNILGLFYSNMERWSYTFQTNAFITRIQKYQQEKKEDKVNLTERCVESDHHLFAHMLKEDGKMNEVEWHYYLNWYQWLVGEFKAKPNGIIYLQCSPEIAYERIQKRQREEENGIPYDYIKRLHEFHENWLLNKTDIPVLILNVDEGFENNEEKMKLMEQQVAEFVRKIYNYSESSTSERHIGH